MTGTLIVKLSFVLFMQWGVGGLEYVLTLEGKTLPNSAMYDATIFKCLEEKGYPTDEVNYVDFEVYSFSTSAQIKLFENLINTKTIFTVRIPGYGNEETSISEWKPDRRPRKVMNTSQTGMLLHFGFSYLYRVSWDREAVSLWYKLTGLSDWKLLVEFRRIDLSRSIKHICLASDKDCNWAIKKSEPTTDDPTTSNAVTSDTATTKSIPTTGYLHLTTNKTTGERVTTSVLEKYLTTSTSIRTAANIPATTDSIANEELTTTMSNEEQYQTTLTREQPVMTTTKPNSLGSYSERNSSTQNTHIYCIAIYNTNISKDQLEAEMKQLREALTVNRKTTTLHLNKLRSADDKRMSAAGIGYVGVAIIAGGLGGIVLVDLMNLVHMFKTMYRNIVK